MENKISRETAENIFQEFLDYYDLDLEEVTEEQAKAWKPSQEKIIKAIMKGRLEIKTEDSFLITQHLKGGETIDYKEITGQAKVTMDKEKGEYGKMYALLGSLSGLGSAALRKMNGRDVSLAETIGFFFLMV